MKRPTHKPGHDVTLASHVRTPVPSMQATGYNRDILRDTVLRVTSVVGTGSKVRPFVVVVRHGDQLHHFAPDDLVRA